MRAFIVGLALVTVAACGSRQVEVRTAPQAEVAVPTIHLTNNLSQAVNVYVVTAASDMFIRQVSANTVMDLPVRGIADGSTVTLRATTIDGTRTYSRSNIVLSGSYAWQVP